MKKPIILVMVLTVFGISDSNAQNKRYYDFFQQEYFFGNAPNAKTEAMGRSDVAIGGSASSSFYNPAGMGTVEHTVGQISYSKPYYALTKSSYLFAGYVYKLWKFRLGATYHRFDSRASGWTVDVNGVKYPVNDPVTTNLGLNLSYEVLEGLHLGLNVNTYMWSIFDDVQTASARHLDVGILYMVPMDKEDKKRKLQFGASVNNFTTSTITYKSPIGDEATSPFPVVARGACAFISAHTLKLPKDQTVDVDLTSTLEYQTLLNNDYRRGINMGVEAIFDRVFALRLGYLRRTLNDFGVPRNKSNLQDLTYGFGVIIPWNEREIKVDYTAIKPPPYTTVGRRLPNRHTFTIHYVLNKPG